MIIKAYKYRIYPTDNQKILIEKHFGCCRWLYNYCLNKNIESYQKDKKHISRFELQKEIPNLKQKEETKWLSDVSSLSLISTLENLDKAYTKFFKEKKGFPKFKSKKDNNKSYSVFQDVKINFNQEKLYIPKFREGINFNNSRTFKGKIKNTTISKTPTNKYYVSILVETNNSILKKKPISKNQTVGIDLGIKMFASISDGTVFENPRFLKKSLKKLKRLQRKHSKKKKGSQNREKSRIKLALQYEKVTNQRKDFLHKTTKQLVTNYDTICLETLKAKNMMKNHKLAQALSDISIGEFNRQIEYKAEWYGCNILRIGQFEPSSKTCSNCGNVKKEISLSERVYNCEKCKHSEDRDMNASKVIKSIGLMTLRQVMSDVKSVEIQQ